MALPKSLYLQYMPDTNTKLQLASLQQDLMAGGVSGRPTRPEVIHLTILHFGCLDLTFAQLLSVEPQLTRLAFDQAVENFIAACVPLLPETITIIPSRIERFGPHGTVVALAAEHSSELIRIHGSVYQELITALQHLGIQNPSAIPHRSRALQVHSVITPHITLVKGVSTAARVYDIPVRHEPLVLSLFPIR